MVVRRITPGKRPQLSDIALGFPYGLSFSTPVQVPDDAGLSIARYWAYREEFIFQLYEVTPEFLRQLHDCIYPAFLSTFESLTTSQLSERLIKDRQQLTLLEESGVRRIPWAGKTAHITWQDLQDPIQELSALSQAIRSVVTPRCLWTDWFINFVLYLMAARHSEFLIDYRDPHVRSLQVRPLRSHMRPDPVDAWDSITFDLQFEISRTSNFDFRALQKAVAQYVQLELEELRAQHKLIRETGRKLKLLEKKRRDHVSWLIQHIICERSYTDIACDETTTADADTARKGVEAAARELGITLQKRGRGGKRK